MTNQEFSDAFDSLVNSFNKDISFGKTSGDIVFDEYEKSIYLTKAQEELMLSYYRGTANGSFDSNEEMKRYFNPLLKEFVKEIEDERYCLEVSLPNDLWFIIYEEAALGDNVCAEKFVAPVVPITNDEYIRVKNNPFRGANGRRALRIDTGHNKITLISSSKISTYTCRYISKLKPIVLIDFEEVSIDGINRRTECELNSTLHRLILDRAVELALLNKTQKTQ